MNPMAEGGLLTPTEYQLLASPALKAAAQVAAERGDPHLYNDMASMLALLGMVSCLTHTYLEQALPGASSREQLESAPLSVCALVFTESGLEAPEVEQCLRALSHAYLRLLKAGVLGPQDALVEQAFVEFMAGERAAGLRNLRLAALAMARAVDVWEAAQNPSPQRI